MTGILEHPTVEDAKKFLEAPGEYNFRVAERVVKDLLKLLEDVDRISEIERARRTQAHEALDAVIRQYAFVTSCFNPKLYGPNGEVHDLKDEIKLQHFNAVRDVLHRQGMKAFGERDK